MPKLGRMRILPLLCQVPIRSRSRGTETSFATSKVQDGNLQNVRAAQRVSLRIQMQIHPLSTREDATRRTATIRTRRLGLWHREHHGLERHLPRHSGASRSAPRARRRGCKSTTISPRTTFRTNFKHHHRARFFPGIVHLHSVSRRHSASSRRFRRVLWFPSQISGRRAKPFRRRRRRPFRRRGGITSITNLFHHRLLPQPRHFRAQGVRLKSQARAGGRAGGFDPSPKNE